MLSLTAIILNIWLVPSIILLLSLISINYCRYKKKYKEINLCRFINFICDGYKIDSNHTLMSTINVAILKVMFIPVANIILTVVLMVSLFILCGVRVVLKVFKIPHSE